LGILTTVVLLPVLLFVVGNIVSDLTVGNPRLKERGLIFAFASLLSAALAMLPAWLSWRYAFSRPRNLRITCPTCHCTGMCRIGVREAIHTKTSFYQESEFGGIHTFTDTGLGEITLVAPGDQTLHQPAPSATAFRSPRSATQTA
jgi:hypothetical protein